MTAGVLFAVAQLVFSGSIGQTRGIDEEPVPWTDCAWCVSDHAGIVHFPGGWRVREGALEREVCEVPGSVFSDGAGELFYFHPPRAELGHVVADAKGLHAGGVIAKLHHWDLVLHAAPSTCRGGFIGRDGAPSPSAVGGGAPTLPRGQLRFFALDKKKKVVFGWTADGKSIGVVFSYADRKDPFVSLAIHPKSGDLLLGTGWPENRICRFRGDGTEVKDHIWPANGYALKLANVGEETWVLGGNAAKIAETRAQSAQCRFGEFANVVRSIAETRDGWWLATSQGAQFYRKNHPESCARRVGGVADVGALALHDGRVLAGVGCRLLNFWLDDQAGDVISSDENWNVAKNWLERIDLIEVRNHVFYIRDAKSGAVTGFDPRVTEWVFRAKRKFDVKDFDFTASMTRVCLGVAGDYVAVAEEGKVRLFHREADAQERLVQELDVKASCLAAEGNWLVAYVPDRRAIWRYKLTR